MSNVVVSKQSFRGTRNCTILFHESKTELFSLITVTLLVVHVANDYLCLATSKAYELGQRARVSLF